MCLNKTDRGKHSTHRKSETPLIQERFFQLKVCHNNDVIESDAWVTFVILYFVPLVANFSQLFSAGAPKIWLKYFFGFFQPFMVILDVLVIFHPKTRKSI